MGEENMALMISDLIGEVAQLELMAKYGIKPNSEFMKKMDERYNTYFNTHEKVEAQVAINTQRDIDMQQSKPTEKIDPNGVNNVEITEKPTESTRTGRSIFNIFRRKQSTNNEIVKVRVTK